MSVKYVVCTIFILGLLSSSQGKRWRIANGDSARAGELPFVVAIRDQFFSRYDTTHTCGGAILTSNLVITAAHCALSHTEVTTGILRKQPNSVHQIVKKIMHKDYAHPDTYSILNDIALLQVTPPFEFNDTFYPVKLPLKDFKVTPGDKLITAGWGVSSTKDWHNPLELEKATVTAVSEDYCKEKYKNMATIFPFQMCTHENAKEGKGPCVGDSGGPLVTKDDVLVGLVSWSEKDPDCATTYPNVYTRVAEYVDWINGKIALEKKILEDFIEQVFGEPPNNETLASQ